MKQAITYQAIPDSGTTKLETFYWNGHDFTTTPHTFDSVSQQEFLKAKEELIGAVRLWPESYNFGINNL